MGGFWGFVLFYCVALGFILGLVFFVESSLGELEQLGELLVVSLDADGVFGDGGGVEVLEGAVDGEETEVGVAEVLESGF